MKTRKPQSAVKIESERRPLAPDFVPGPYDCICARGKAAANHPGNVRFRSIIQQYKPVYAEATTKVEKSLLVSEIVDSVRGMSPNGGFVKKIGNQWYEVGDSVCREKIGQCLRDALHTSYKSSTKAKKNRRKELRQMKKESEQEPHHHQQQTLTNMHTNLAAASATRLERLDSFGSTPFPLLPIPLQSQSSMALLREFAASHHHHTSV
eukprot:Sro52_g030980.1 Nitrilase family, member 2 (208) ;mRNA; r:66493-67116